MDEYLWYSEVIIEFNLLTEEFEGCIARFTLLLLHQTAIDRQTDYGRDGEV